MQSYLNIRGLLGLLRRQRRVVLSIFLVTMVLIAVATFSLQSVYTASATVVVNPTGNSVLQAGRAGGDLSDSARIDTEALTVRAPEVMRLVAERLDLYSLPEFQPRQGMAERILVALNLRKPQQPTEDQIRGAVLGNLSANTFVQRRGLTFALGISAQSSDPVLAAAIANATAKAYIDVQVQRKVEATTSSRDVIEARIADAATATQGAEEALDRYTSDQVELLARASGNPNVATIREQIEQITGRRTQFTSTLDTITTAIANRDWLGLSSSIDSPEFQTLQQRRNDIQAQMREQAENTSTVLNLREELAGVQASLLAEANQEADSLTNQITAAQAVASNLRDQLREVIVSADLPSDVLMQIFTLQQTAEVSRGQYQTLLERLKELDTQAYLQVADSILVAEADASPVPSFPNTRLFMMMGAIVAAGLAVGSAVLVENYVGGFTSSAQVEAVLRAPTVAVVPRTKVPRSASGAEENTVADLVVDAPLSTFTESIRRMRVGADRMIKQSKPGPGMGGVVMVTSAVPAEGKTSLALSLARSYHMAGQACLLIDCDLRKPSLHKLLNVERNAGLLDLLNSNGETVSLESIVVNDPRTGGPVIVGSHRSNSATDHFINGPEFARMIQATRKVFDVVVLDTPPVIPVVDSLYLAELADAVIFVAQWGSTSQAEARTAIRALAKEVRQDVEIVVALNQDADDQTRGKYKDYYSQ